MTNRAHLRRQNRQAWATSLAEDYASQRINSERSLQASLWAQLNSLLPRATRRMFIEPCFAIRGEVSQLRYPDLVICNSRAVIAVVELKYLPRTQPDWHKDIGTFRWIVENKTALSVTNARFRGVGADERVYPLAEDLLYVWQVSTRPRTWISWRWQGRSSSPVSWHCMPRPAPPARSD